MNPDRVAEAAFDAVGAPLCIVSADGTIRRSNDALLELSGRETLDGEHAGALFQSDSFEAALDSVFASDEESEVVRQTTLEVAGGGHRPCEVTLTRLATREPLAVVSVDFRDGQAVASLADREAAYREMYEVIADREKSFDEQVSALLDIGCRTLGTKYGTLSHVEGDQYVFEIVQAEDGAVEAGDTIPISATVCERVVSTEGDVVIGDLAAETPDTSIGPGYRPSVWPAISARPSSSTVTCTARSVSTATSARNMPSRTGK